MLDQSGLRDEGDVGFVTALDASLQNGLEVVSGSAVGDTGPGLLLEERQDLFEGLLFVAGPGADDLQALTVQVRAVGGRRTIVTAGGGGQGQAEPGGAEEAKAVGAAGDGR